MNVATSVVECWIFCCPQCSSLLKLNSTSVLLYGSSKYHDRTLVSSAIYVVYFSLSLLEQNVEQIQMTMTSSSITFIEKAKHGYREKARGPSSFPGQGSAVVLPHSLPAPLLSTPKVSEGCILGIQRRSQDRNWSD